MKFGDRLKNARMEMNLTQEQVANDFFITRQTISSWENEKTYPDISNLIKLSDYYHISLDLLLKEDTGMKEYLERKEVERSIKPILRILLIIDVLVLVLLTLTILNIIHLNHAGFLILIILGVLNAVARFQLSTFQRKIDIRTTKKLSISTKSLFLSGALFVVGILVASLTDYYLIGGLISGIGGAIFLIYFAQRNK
ncbi:MAG: helix-turn-helix domain-containing protein [Liquorilactobacillus ghanensis]|uniref:helix-turn-helix domain-containing protein n=1 Tax=Liquorilactobacillus ghanensis TaxID=399370 RepID=UPI0039EC8C51